MSDTLQVYANIPTLNDRASKKKQRAWKFYGGGQPVPIQVTAADGTTLVGHIEGTWAYLALLGKTSVVLSFSLYFGQCRLKIRWTL